MNLLDLVFPPHCLGCHSLGTYLCPACVNRLSLIHTPICPACHRPSLTGITHPHCQPHFPLRGLISTLAYTGLSRQFIERFKYQFSHHLLTTLTEITSTFTDFSPLASKKTWLLIPVPLHPHRLHWRGFNQSQLLSQALSAYTHWPTDSNLLYRLRPTAPQMSLPRSQRLTNLKDAFALAHPLPKPCPPLLLIDDVWTSGTTLTECARTLKRHGAKQIWAYTLARTLQH